MFNKGKENHLCFYIQFQQNGNFSQNVIIHIHG